MESKAKAVIERYQMLKPEATVIVALSGGADSIALIYYLNSIKIEYNINLIAAHVNHGIRGAEADRDEQFVKDFCDTIGVELKVLHVNVPKISKDTGESEEICGRRIRYEFFESIDNIAYVATAHTLSDNVETVLFNLTRGSALKGLCGIPPVRGNIIRPLIDCSRQDIEEYCKKNNLKYVTDSTNNLTEYSRNKIRHKVVPVLKNINPSFENTLNRCCNAINNDEDYLNTVVNMVVEQSKIANGYNIDIIKNQHIAIRYRVIKAIIIDNLGVNPEQKHIELVNDILEYGGQVEICNSCYVRVKNRILDFPNYKNSYLTYKFSFELGTLYINGLKIQTKVINRTEYEQKIKNGKDMFDIFLDYDKIEKHSFFRSRLSGDKFTSHKRKNTKTLKKLFNEAKIPIEKRNSIVILANDNEIFWIEGFGASEHASVTKATQRVLMIKIWR